MIGGRPGWLRRFGHETITVHRRSAGTRDANGEWFPGAVGLMAVEATTAPEGRMREVGLSGTRLEAERMLWTTERLQAATTTRDADVVTYDSELWRVESVNLWPNFFEVGLVRLEDQSDATLVAGTSVMERGLRRHVAMGSGLFTADLSGAITALQVIPANGPGPAPAGVFATVLVSSRTQEGEPYRVDTQPAVTDPLTATTARQILAQVSIQFHRPGAVAAGEHFLNWAESPAGKLAEENLDMMLVPPFRDRRVDTMVGDRLEERLVVDLAVRYLGSIGQAAGTIEDVPLELARAGYEYATSITS